MNEKTKNHWMSVNAVTWVIMLAVSFFVFFPAFIALIIIWLIGRVRVIENQ